MPTPVTESVREKIGKAIVAGNLSLAEIAKANHVSESYVSKMRKAMGGGAKPSVGRARSTGDVDLRDVIGNAAPRQRKARAPADPLAGILGALEPAALPLLREREKLLENTKRGIDSELLRVRALIALHVGSDVPEKMEPEVDPRQEKLFEGGQPHPEDFAYGTI